PKIEGLIIATPHHLHFEQVMQALDGGKHVLIEKPMALDAMQARQMAVGQMQQVIQRQALGKLAVFVAFGRADQAVEPLPGAVNPDA
ncbi:MAG: Gfo/Idh/MocA family oxidoreductase, partial [Actinobacteria bacterium]|nr:Gfo/Idh/MocA family oxidoreductase [Actinomycetota bacterium]